jgi:2-polyprenyl-6-methoxyphenol hydroxylase-like FAD-dependent oxidoreductase
MLNETGQRGKTAVVIGASMAGLLAARALADHFEQVTLLERDLFPEPGENRRGVPQGKHTHVLLELGRQIMEDYLPGLTDDLVERGAVSIADAGCNVRWFRDGYHRPGASDVAGVGVSRPILEALVRARVLSLPNVQALEGCKVLGLVATNSNSHRSARVTGVRLARCEASIEETMMADLVVDATGRGSRSQVWLEGLGYRRPEVEQVRVDLGYTTCYFRRQPEHPPDLDGIVLIPTPPDRRMGVLLAQEGNRWVVTLGGYLGDHVPANYEAFLRAARNLPSPDIYHVIEGAELLREPVAYKFRANVRHRYEELDRFPGGYLILGDALCSFNPIYGQGMTVAALEAVALGECLTAGHDRLAERFFGRARKIVDGAWDTAVGTDLGFAEVEGPRTPMVRFLNWYIGKLHAAAHADAQVSIAFLRVINMLAPPPSILHPRIVWRVIKGNLAVGQRNRAADTEILADSLDGAQAEDVDLGRAGENVEMQRQMFQEY